LTYLVIREFSTQQAYIQGPNLVEILVEILSFEALINCGKERRFL